MAEDPQNVHYVDCPTLPSVFHRRLLSRQSRLTLPGRFTPMTAAPSRSARKLTTRCFQRTRGKAMPRRGRTSRSTRRASTAPWRGVPKVTPNPSDVITDDPGARIAR